MFAPPSSTDGSEAALVTVTQELSGPFRHCSPHSRQSTTHALYKHQLLLAPTKSCFLGFPPPHWASLPISLYSLLPWRRYVDVLVTQSASVSSLLFLSLDNVVHFQKFKYHIYSRSFPYLCRSRYPDFWTPYPISYKMY